MDEDFYNEASDTSVEENDEDVRPAYTGAFEPYMFEPTMAPEDAAIYESASKKAQSDSDGRRLADVSKWYGNLSTLVKKQN